MSDRSKALRCTQVGLVVMGMHELFKARSVGLVLVGIGLLLMALHYQLFFKMWEKKFTELDGEPDSSEPIKSSEPTKFSLPEVALRIVGGGILLIGLVVEVVSTSPAP